MQAPSFLNLGTGFSKYFTAVPALTAELKHKAYEIRHEVYCKEMSYEPVRPEGIETDAYDEHSIHCLLKSNADGEYIGCVRLVVARAADPSCPFPFEILCATTLDRAIIDPAKLPRERIAEVSRLAVVSRYRRRKGDAKRPADISDEDFSTSVRPRFPYTTVGLYLGMMAQAQRHGIETLFVVTEMKLAKHLSWLGIRLQTIGGLVEHRGQRVPAVIRVDEVIRGFGDFVRPLYEVIAGDIHAEYRALGL